MTTKEFTSSLRARYEGKAADRLEELERANKNTLADLAVAIEQRDEAFAEIKKMRKERDNASAEVEWMRKLWNESLIAERDDFAEEIERVKAECRNQQLNIRPEPSRLEIAARKLTQLEEKVSELSTQLVDAKEYVQSERSHLQAVRDVLLAHKVPYSENSDMAEWVEELAFQRDAHRAEEERIKKERDEARLDVERLWALNGRVQEENREARAKLEELERTRQRLLDGIRVAKEERDEFLTAKIQGMNCVDGLEKNLIELRESGVGGF